jgi:hypothetical protein
LKEAFEAALEVSGVRAGEITAESEKSLFLKVKIPSE